MGVLLGIQKNNWHLGGNSAIEHSAFIPDGNWKQWEIEHEIQFYNDTDTPYDTLFCVTFSALACIGAIFTYHLHKGNIPTSHAKWLTDNGYFKNGFVNFNERYTAIKGGTGTNGAWQWQVADGIRKWGLIPQDAFPMADNFTENISVNSITPELEEKGKEFLKRFQINYEWVADFKEGLKYSPIQTVVRFANYNKPTDILKPEGAYNHAVKGIFATQDYNEIRDTYWQVYKRYHPDYTRSFMAFNLLTLNNNMDTNEFIKNNDTRLIRNTNTGAYGVIYAGNFLKISQERAGLFTIDRLARNLEEKGVVAINQAEWDDLDKENKYF